MPVEVALAYEAQKREQADTDRVEWTPEALNPEAAEAESDFYAPNESRKSSPITEELAFAAEARAEYWFDSPNPDPAADLDFHLDGEDWLMF
ncbi:hypothetical protein [Sphaerothrix gracilis]|uniref:hypothetical protein n=1 Tax=Sphaerothrix gracilis TaxID=3151835 RepID=UPI0031FC4F67